MAAPDPAGISRRIVAARERAGVTQVDLAAAVSLDRSALSKIENGTRRVSAVELAHIADVLHERIEWFVSDAPPSIISHRNQREPGAPSPAVDLVVERIARNVEFVLRTHREWVLGSVAPLPRPATMAEAEGSAAMVREILELDSSVPLTDVSSSASKVGLLVFSLDLGTESADAASVLLQQGGIALVNGSLKVGRRRLAFAHDLGHHVFADEYVVDYHLGDRDDAAAWEARLDRFARAILAPPDGIESAWDGARSLGDDLRTAAVKVASHFRLDMSTLSRRLLELHLINHAEADHVRSVRTTRADIVEHDLLISEDLAAPSLPREYEAAVLRLYREDTISAARAIDLLLDVWTEEDLPPLPPLPENAIWNFVS